MKPCYEESLVSIDLTNKKPGVWYTFKNGEWSELRPKLDQVVETKFKEKGIDLNGADPENCTQPSHLE